MNWKESDLAYLAGFFDGEGSVLIAVNNGKNYQLRVCVTSNDFEIIDFLHKKFRGYVYKRRYDSRKSNNTNWIWSCQSELACQFLELIVPFSKIKKAEVETGIYFHRTKQKWNTTEEERNWRKQMRLILHNLKQTRRILKEYA